MFGQPQQSSPFGSPAPAFGQAPAPSAFGGGGGFGSPAPAPGGFGGGFGQPSAPSTFGGGGGGFGNPSPAPAFGTSGGFGSSSNTTSFGAAPSTSAFGQSSAPSAFGTSTGFGSPSPAPAFGSSTGFGQSSGGFGSSAPSSSPFGAPAPGGLFGGPAPAPSGGLFGSTAPAPAFGAPAPAFGTSAPSTGLFGSPSPAPAFGAAPAPSAFGQASVTGFGAPAPTGGIFGAPAPAGGMFGGGAAPGAPGGGGTKAIQFTPAQIQDGDKTITMQSISVMPQYERKSFEELRYEDYMQGNKGMGNASGGGFGGGFNAPAPAGGGLFGSPPAPAFGAAPSPGAFGAPALAPFGAPAPSSFGGGGFGSSSPAPVPGGFGAPAPSVFGNPAPAPGAFGAPAPGGFGSSFGTPASGSLFGGNPAPAPGGSLFGGSPTSAPSFGAPSQAPGLFGSPSPAPAPGLFGAPSPAPSGGIFGAPSPAPFGAPAPSAFGSGGFGSPATGGLFGNPAPAPAFGSTSGSLFGSPAPAPAFGAPAPGAFFGSPPPAPTPGMWGGQQPASAAMPLPLAGSIIPQAANEVLQNQIQALENKRKEMQKLDAWKGSSPDTSNVIPASQPQYDGGNMASAALNNSQYLSYRPSPRSTAKIRPRGFGSPSPAVTSSMASAALSKIGTGGRPMMSPEGYAASSVKRLVIKPETMTPNTKMRLRLTNGPVTGDSVTQALPVPLDKTSPTGNDTKVDAPSPVQTPRASIPVYGRETPKDSMIPNSPGKTMASLEKLAPPTDPAMDYYKKVVESHDGTAPAPVALHEASSGRKQPSYIPKLTKPGYVVSPSIERMATMSEAELATLSGFSIEHKPYGKVEWDGEVDVRNADLDASIEIGQADVGVYHTDEEAGCKPPPGSKLNRPCRITFYNIFPKTGPKADAEAKEKYCKRIAKSTSKMDAKLISYDPDTGVWQIRVESF